MSWQTSRFVIESKRVAVIPRQLIVFELNRLVVTNSPGDLQPPAGMAPTKLPTQHISSGPETANDPFHHDPPQSTRHLTIVCKRSVLRAERTVEFEQPPTQRSSTPFHALLTQQLIPSVVGRRLL